VLEHYTDERWNLRSFPEYAREIAELQDVMRVELPCYPYLAYLRHHGFPSPLLDWTESASVAAYFAYMHETAKWSGWVLQRAI
jgi:hypothetical protein